MKHKLLLAAGMLCVATAPALAQPNHGAGTQANNTVAGIFVPQLGRGSSSPSSSYSTVSSTTPVSVAAPASAPASVGQVLLGGAGAQAALAQLTLDLQANNTRGPRQVFNVSSATAQALANCLTLLGTTPTVQSVVNALNAFNNAVPRLGGGGLLSNPAFLAIRATLAAARASIPQATRLDVI